MALTNFMGATSYTIIKRCSYDKQDRNLSMEISVFTSSSKQIQIASFRKECQGTNNAGYEVLDRNLTAPPQSPTEGDAYLVAANATGAWVGLDGKVLAWNGASWDEMAWPDQIFVADEQIVLRKDGSSWTKDPQMMSNQEFDSLFSVAQIGGVDNNILKCCYEYLKTLPEFAGAQDV